MFKKFFEKQKSENPDNKTRIWQIRKQATQTALIWIYKLY